MTKGTKVFRVIICILLGLTMLFGAFFSLLFVLHIEKDVMGAGYGIYVAGVRVTRNNEDDILGDGTVYYSAYNNVLTFDNATIDCNDTIVYSTTDLMIELLGENKMTMSGDYLTVIYVADHLLTKDLAFIGDGALTVELTGTSGSAMGIFAKDLRVETDISITMPDSVSICNGIYCEGALTITNGATVTVNNGSSAYSTAVKACNNVSVELGAALNVSIAPGTTELCRGLTVGGSLIVWDDATLNVTVDDQAAKTSECISVYGLLSVSDNARVTAAAKKAYGIECFGSVELGKDATISSLTEAEGVDMLCYGAIVNYGAEVNSEVEALGGIYSK